LPMRNSSPSDIKKDGEERMFEKEMMPSGKNNWPGPPKKLPPKDSKNLYIGIWESGKSVFRPRTSRGEEDHVSP